MSEDRFWKSKVQTIKPITGQIKYGTIFVSRGWSCCHLALMWHDGAIYPTKMALILTKKTHIIIALFHN